MWREGPQPVSMSKDANRSFSKKKLAVLNDSYFKGIIFGFFDEKVSFSYILDSGAFTTAVPKLLVKSSRNMSQKC